MFEDDISTKQLVITVTAGLIAVAIICGTVVLSSYFEKSISERALDEIRTAVMESVRYELGKAEAK